VALEELRQARLEKLKKIADPYPTATSRTHAITQAEGEGVFVLAGRVMAMRGHGAITFMDLQDGSGKIQLFLKDENPSETIDIGDFIETEGTLFITKAGEKTLHVTRYTTLAKSLLPLPEKWHGLQDVEERFRKRYLDLLMNPEVREKFQKRAEIIQNIRSFLLKNNFLEVTTPTLQPLYGGASARPFKTHMHALDMDLFLRIAPELYLKRLLAFLNLRQIFATKAWIASTIRNFPRWSFTRPTKTMPGGWSLSKICLQ